MRKIVRCNIFFVAGAILLAAGHVGSAAPQVAAARTAATPPPAWRPVDAETGEVADIVGLQQLVAAYPNSSSVQLRLLNAHLAAEDWAQALPIAEALVAQGYSFSPRALRFLASRSTSRARPAWLDRSERNGRASEASEVVATLPAEARLPESLLVLDGGGFFVTDVVARGSWLHQGEGWAFQSAPQAGNISGVVQHPRHAQPLGVAWMASGNLGMVPEGEEVFSGLLSVPDGASRRPAPEGVNLSDIAMGRDGIIFASDPLGGGVYRAAGPRNPVMTVVAPGTLRSPQGIAPHPDGRRLYISDYRYGLAIIDTASGKVSRLASDTPMLLDGIDGMWWHDGGLIAVQNGLSPQRIIALRLSRDGNRITAMRVLEQAHPAWTEPLGGDVHDGALYYIGNGSWDLFREGGALREGAQLRRTQIRRLQLADNPAD